MAIHPVPQRSGRARRELIGAWISAAIAVLSVFGVFQVSDPGAGLDRSIWFLAPVMLLASASAAWFGLRARRHGEEDGRWPAFVGLVIGGFFALMGLAGLIAHYLLGFE